MAGAVNANARRFLALYIFETVLCCNMKLLPLVHSAHGINVLFICTADGKNPMEKTTNNGRVGCRAHRQQYNRLHARYVAGILKEATARLKRLPNLNQASTAISKQVTICGDLHGKLDDLLVVFHKVRKDTLFI